MNHLLPVIAVATTNLMLTAYTPAYAVPTFTILGGLNSGTGLNTDGSMFVGNSIVRDHTIDELVTQAFRGNSGFKQNLGTLGGSEAFAAGISADGSTVVGTSILIVRSAGRMASWKILGRLVKTSREARRSMPMVRG